MKKIYHKGGTTKKRDRTEGEGEVEVESLKQPKLNNNNNNTNNLCLLANISSKQNPLPNNSGHIIDDIKLTEILSGIQLPSNITNAMFIDYNLETKLNVGNIIECHVNQIEYRNERWFGIVTEIVRQGVYVKWFKENTLNLEKINRNKKTDLVRFSSIKGVLQL